MKERIIQFIDSIEEKIISYRRDFHKYPEIGWTEFRTASKIARRLIELGFEVKLGREVLKDEDRMGLPSEEELGYHYERALEQGADEEFIVPLKNGFTGVMGILDLGDGPSIGLRFDIDALKVLEDSSDEHLPYKLKFASVNQNVMHACGHDCHAAIGLGVAEVLSSFKDEIDGIGRIKLIFQPAEEGVRGAKAMVGAGVLDDVDYIIGGHIGLKPSKILVCGTNGFMATTKFDVNFKGKGSHAGGAPNEGNNSMLAACTAVLNLNAIPRHMAGASRINVGVLSSGTDRNVIPEESFMKVETRGESTEINDYVRDYALRIIENSAQMHNTNYEVKYMGAAMCGDCSKELVERISKIGNSLGCFDNITNISDEAGGSEDFTFMLNKVQDTGGQGAYFIIGSDTKGGHHNAKFDVNEKDVINAVKMFTMIALDILEKN
ncbi:amidohydrolase [Wukongibacter baidiensis]|uniref:amidohydrolase n=1 Tax=Wukongibacter baidiensis TaxID=1723361 RepID=UPI003D7F2E1A